jgi:hypothetical protein
MGSVAAPGSVVALIPRLREAVSPAVTERVVLPGKPNILGAFARNLLTEVATEL